MELTDLVAKLETEFALASGTLKADTGFRDIPEWGSMHALIIIALVDTEYGVTLNGEDLKKAATVNDLFNVVKSKIA